MRSQRGSLLVEFLILLPALILATYSGVEFWYVARQRDMIASYMHRSLARMQVEGFLPMGEETALRSDLSRVGCKTVTLTGPLESQGSPRVLRPADVSLLIECEPAIKPLTVGRILQSPGPNGLVIRVGGRIVSERVDP